MMMHDDQVTIGLDTARAMIREQFPGWGRLPVVEVPTDGTVNAIFRIGPELAARFPLRATEPDALTAALRAEAAAMTELAGCCPFPTPLPVAVGKPGDAYPMPWSIQTWLPGEVATPTGLSTSTVFARDLVTLIGTLRAADTRGRRFSGGGRGGLLTDHDDWMNLCLEKSEGILDVARLRSLWARFRELPVAERQVMSHRDLIPANLLVNGEHLVGVLDGGDFGPADPALDLVAAWNLLDRDARRELRAALDSDTTEWRRGAAWAFIQSMGVVWYYQSSNPGMSALGRRTLQRILDDPDIG